MTLAGGVRCVILRETGELLLAAASPHRHSSPVAQAQILPPTVRAHPALDRRVPLYARNSDTRTATICSSRIDLRPLTPCASSTSSITSTRG